MKKLNNAWKGRYAQLIAELVRHGNIASRANLRKINYPSFGFSLASPEWQILEYIVERPDDSNMATISNYLGIVPSTMTKYTKTLMQLGLIEKYHTESNKKNIILKPSSLGLRFYEEKNAGTLPSMFDGIHTYLEDLSDNQLKAVCKAIHSLDDQITEVSNKNEIMNKLIRIHK